MDPSSSSQLQKSNFNRSIKPLIILDLNKVLVDKSSAYIIPKEGAAEFIKKLMSNYDVAIWSSMYRKNVSNSIKVLKLPKIYRFKFVWSRNKTDPDPDAGNKGIPNYATVKRLSKIRQKSKMILIDDNVRKLRFNPENTRLVYSGESYTKILKKIVVLLASQK